MVYNSLCLFFIVNTISENDIERWYNGTIDLSTYSKMPEIRMIPHEYKDLYAVYLYPSDFTDEKGYLSEEEYNKIQYENFGVYATLKDAQEGYIKLNNYFKEKMN